MLAIRDTFVKNPHASLFVLFVGAFTVFALSGDDPKKRKPSLLRKVLSYLATHEEHAKEQVKRTRRKPQVEKSHGIVVLLEVRVKPNY